MTERPVAGGDEPLRVEVVHQGRGGHIEIEGRRYSIEHVGDGRFCIAFPSGNRHARLAAHLEALMELERSDPSRWYVESRSKRLPRPPE